MRALFAFVGGVGHLQPLVPIARGVAGAGHTVKFACAPSIQERVAHAGFDAFELGPTSRPSASQRLPLRAVDRAREERELRERFVERAAHQRIPLVAGVCERFAPDVIVCDETDFGSMLAAELSGIPYACVQVIAAGSFLRRDVVGEALGEVRDEQGLPPDPALEMLHRFLVLSPVPPSFRDPGFPPPATLHPIRPTFASGTATGPPDDARWRRARAPLVYCTLGTIFNSESGDLLSRLTAGSSRLGGTLVVTVGHEIDPAELGPQPSHVHVERFVPQDEILPHCALVVSHGGSGSVIGALSHGLPSVLVPLGADQPLNGDRCSALGVAKVLDPLRATPEVVHEAARQVLDDPRYRAAAGGISREIASLPDPLHAVPLLERLAAEGTPVRRSSAAG